MSVPLVKVFQIGEKPTAEDFNAVIQILASKFGALQGRDFFWPLVLSGDLDMSGNRLLRVREMFGNLNLEEYGSDETAFEQAINELSNGGLIFVPRSNVIELARSIKIRSNRKRVNIYGAGHSSQLKIANNADSPAISIDGGGRFTIGNLFINGNKFNNAVGQALRIVNCEDFVIENLWIGGTVSSPGDAGCAQSAISVENCRSFQIKRVWIRNTTGPAIRVSSCDDFEISQCTLRDGTDPERVGDKGAGIVLFDSIRGRVFSNEINAMSDAGIRVINCHDTRVYANHVKDCVNVGIHVQGESKENPSAGVFLQGNSIAGSAVGMSLGSNIFGQATSNHLRGNVIPLQSTAVDNVFGLQNNQVMDVKNHGVVTMLANQIFVDLNVGVSGLPIQAIHATWRYERSTTDLQDSVLGAVYGVNGAKTVTFYSATSIGRNADLYYSIYV